MTDWPIVGHTRIVEMLRRDLRQGRVAHALLLAGPPGVGKRPLARAYAQALNCLGVPGALEDTTPAHGYRDIPCGRCRNCVRIAHDTYPDVEWFSLERQAADAATQGRSGANKELSIETVRTLERSVSLRPYEGHWRVAILEDAEHLSLSAANALLKTLEEPPSYTVLILLADDPGALLPTIRSRCRVDVLRPLPRPVVERALQEQWAIAPAQATLLAALAGGRLGWAVAMGLHPDRLLARQELLTTLAGLGQQDLPDRFAFAAELAGRFAANRAAVFDLLALWAGWWRDLLLVRAGVGDLVQNTDRIDTLRRLAPAYDQAQIVAFLAAIEAARQALDQNLNPRLVLESLVLQLPNESLVVSR
jgi:DNA polymerase-3 subunit delta'